MTTALDKAQKLKYIFPILDHVNIYRYQTHPHARIA
jgi:hypothetical protein